MARTSALVEIEGENSESLAANDFDNTSDRSAKNAQSNGEDTVGENTPDNFPNTFSGDNSQTSWINNLILYGATFLVLLAALIFAILYRRRSGKR